MQRSRQARFFKSGIEPVGFAEGGRVYGNDRIARRALFVERVDAREIHLDQRARGQGSGLRLGMHVIDRGLDHLEGLFGAVRHVGGAKRDRKKGEEKPAHETLPIRVQRSKLGPP